MKHLNLILTTLLLFTNLACSSTQTVQIDKKPLLSDHHLMMSLLNRPVTGDQQLMLAFARQQDSYQQELMPVFVNAVYLRGEKSPNEKVMRNQGIYSTLIAEDINAIQIQGL